MSSYSLPMDLAAICFASCVVLGALFYSSTIIYSNASMDQPPLAYSPGLRLSPINLFIGPQCKWRTPIRDVPKNIEFQKTVVAGFPSEENNVIRLMEALTGFGEFYLYIFMHLFMRDVFWPILTSLPSLSSFIFQCIESKSDQGRCYK